jgi:hypothetical protein
MQSFHNFLTAHIVAIDKTHSQNFLNAGYYFVMLLTAEICTLIHTIFPFLFESTSSRIILKLHGKMTARKLFHA